MRIPAAGGWRGRLAKLATVPAVAAVIAACTEQSNTNPTGDSAAPNLFGQTSNGIGFPHEVVTTEGIASAGLYLPIFLIAVAIFILIEGLLLFLALRFRKRSEGDDLPEQVHGSNKLEIIWTAIPMAVVFVLFIGSTVVLTGVESKSEEHGAVVDVTAFRFGWIFEYQDPATFDTETGQYQPVGITISGGGREGAPEMRLPVGEPVLIRLNAADVIHSWYVPSFFFKRDAIPGRLNEFELTIEQPGIYGGQCAEFCGLAHGDMFFSVNAMAPADYDAWLAEQTQVPPAAGDVPAGEVPAAGDVPAGEVPAAGDVPAGEVPAAGDVPAGEVVMLEVNTTADKAIAYDTSDLEAPAGQTVTVTYRNDSNVPHNIAFYDGPDASSQEIDRVGDHHRSWRRHGSHVHRSLDTGSLLLPLRDPPAADDRDPDGRAVGSRNGSARPTHLLA